MIKAAVNSSLLLTAMMASGISFADTDNTSLDNLTAMDGFFNEEMEIPIVLTAARLRQSQLDTPASVTVIESATIEALGFKDIEEIFRLVPGMLVGYHSGVGEKTASVSYHGTNLPEHRRLQVLIDGRSVYKPGLSRVEWSDIPLAVEDIARIEVIRGANSAAYGANAFLGIINILTKHPQSEQGLAVKLTAGGRDVANSYMNISGKVSNTDFRWTIGSKQKSGFDVLTDGLTENRDGIEAKYTSLRTFTQIAPELSMEWQAGFKTGTNEQRQLHADVVDYLDEEDIDADDYFIWQKTNYEFSASQFSHLQVYSQKFDRSIHFRVCFAGSTNCGDVDKSLVETKTEIEFQHTSNWDDSFRTVAGVRARLDEFDSETYNDGYTKNTNYSAFASGEYRFAEKYVANVGGMFESDDLGGDNLAPRFALNTHLTDTDTIRLIYSEAIRTPDLFETGGQLVFTFENFTVDGVPVADNVVPFGQASATLESEEIKSYEVSYFGLFPSIQAQLDVKLFYDELSGLIAESLNHSDPLTNSIRMNLSGVEAQLSWDLDSQNKLIVTAAHVNMDNDFESNQDEDGVLTTEAIREASLSADTSGNIVWMHQLDSNSYFSTALYHVNNWGPYIDGGFEFTRLDLNASHRIEIGSEYTMTFQAALQHRFDSDPLSRPKNKYTDDTFMFGSIRLGF